MPIIPMYSNATICWQSVQKFYSMTSVFGVGGGFPVWLWDEGLCHMSAVSPLMMQCRRQNSQRVRGAMLCPVLEYGATGCVNWRVCDWQDMIPEGRHWRRVGSCVVSCNNKPMKNCHTKRDSIVCVYCFEHSPSIFSIIDPLLLVHIAPIANGMHPPPHLIECTGQHTVWSAWCTAAHQTGVLVPELQSL